MSYPPVTKLSKYVPPKKELERQAKYAATLARKSPPPMPRVVAENAAHNTHGAPPKANNTIKPSSNT